MSTVPCQSAPRRRWQFTLASLLALLTVSAVVLAWVGQRMRPPVMHARIFGSDAVVVQLQLGRGSARTVSPAELTAEVDRLRQSILDIGVVPQAVTVQMTVDDEMPCRVLKQVMLACLAAGMTEFELRLDAETWGHVSLATLKEDFDVCEPLLVPYKVRLQADAAGDLTQVSLGDRHVSLAEMRQTIRMHVTNGTPGPVETNFEAILNPDDALKFEHLVAGWAHTAWYVEPSGRRIQLMRRMFPFDAAHALGWYMEEMEDAPVEVSDVKDVDKIDLSELEAPSDGAPPKRESVSSPSK